MKQVGRLDSEKVLVAMSNEEYARAESVLATCKEKEKKFIVSGVDYRGISYLVSTRDVEEAVAALRSLRKICTHTHLEFPV